MFQPPWDVLVEDRFIIHYTYGCDYDLKVSYFILIAVWCETKVDKLYFYG